MLHLVDIGYSSSDVVFKKEKSGFTQSLHLAGIIYHHEPQQTWSQKELTYDFFSLKAEISKLLQTSGMQNIELQKASSLAPFNENVLDVFIGKQKIGVMGEIDLSVTEKLIKKQAHGFVIYPEKISLSTVNPNSFINSPPGADSPKVCIPTTKPSKPTNLCQ